jgi:hypothetical protein
MSIILSCFTEEQPCSQFDLHLHDQATKQQRQLNRITTHLIYGLYNTKNTKPKMVTDPHR